MANELLGTVSHESIEAAVERALRPYAQQGVVGLCLRSWAQLPEAMG